MTPDLDIAAHHFPLVAKAVEYGRRFHSSHQRPFTNEAYNEHTEAVGNLVARYTKDPVVIAAGVLHDKLEEDPDETAGNLMGLFGGDVAELVVELTPVVTRSRHPDLNRTARSKKEAARLGTISPNGKLIKLADIVHNTSNIEVLPSDFADVYLNEKREVLPLLRVPGSAAHEGLYMRAASQLGMSFLQPPRNPVRKLEPASEPRR